MPIASPSAPTTVWITSSKGGSGKSTLACLLVDYYRTRNIPTAAYDADPHNRTLGHFYAQRDLEGRLRPDREQDPLRGVGTFDARRPDARALFAHAAARIVVDLPPGGAEDLAGTSVDLFGATLSIVVILVSSSTGAAAAVGPTIDAFGPRPHYIAVRNLGSGKNFPAFDGARINGADAYRGARRALATVGGTIIDLPALPGESWAHWDCFAAGPLAHAVTHPRLERTDHLRLIQWRADFATAITGTPLA